MPVLVVCRQMQLKARMACGNTAHTVMGPQAWLLDAGSRLHLQHGPIDLIIEAKGRASEVRDALQQAAAAFEIVLETLVAELAMLRQPFSAANESAFHGVVAKRMQAAITPFANESVTPMIAVAGAVADHVLSCMLAGRELSRVQVNNGGDIAIELSPGEKLRIGICNNLQTRRHTDIIDIVGGQGIGGIATSGWQGRSHSLGIADAVTVLAKDAARADTAATLIANAVDLPNSTKIRKVPANTLAPDSDLNDRLVTVSVARLTPAEIDFALHSGKMQAEQFVRDGLAHSVYLHLQGQTCLVGALASTKYFLAS